VSLALIDNLRQHLLAAPSEYSYFDQGRLGAWAGPRHWKFKPVRNPQTLKNMMNQDPNQPPGNQQQAAKGKGKNKKAVPEEYEFEEVYAQGDLNVLLDSVEKGMNIPKKSIKLQSQTMERWSEDRFQLPRDLDYKGKDFSKSFIADFHITGRPLSKGRSQNLDDTVGDYNFENPNDTAEFCPNNADPAEEAGNEDDDDYQMDGFDDATMFPTQTQGNDIDNLNLSMVQAPNRVEKVQIGYAKQAKKMDMRRLKTIEWKILHSARGSEDKENNDGNGQSAAANEDKMKSPITFKDMYQTLHEPHRMPPKMVENLSVPLAFVALLHLCNEKSLALEGQEDFSDFTIRQD